MNERSEFWALSLGSEVKVKLKVCKDVLADCRSFRGTTQREVGERHSSNIDGCQEGKVHELKWSVPVGSGLGSFTISSECVCVTSGLELPLTNRTDTRRKGCS